jgi:hypothetical protein
MRALQSVLFLLLLAGCEAEPTEPTEPVVELTWSEMDFAERQAYMASDVMPAMQDAFAAYDSTRFATITCATCHGSGATDGTFSMPTDDLFAIEADNFPTGAGAAFMSNVVVPEMADLLGVDAFDPLTGEGFGCFGCHPAQD